MDEHPFQQQRQLLREFRKAVTTRQQQEQEADRRRQTEQQDTDRTLKQTLEQAKRHRDQEEGRITQKYQAALRTAEDTRAAKRAQAERSLKETESETRSRYQEERKQADTLLEQVKEKARKSQEEEIARAQKRYEEMVKAAEETWAQAQKLAADGQAKSHKDLKQCMDYLLYTGLSTALIPAEIPPAAPEGMTGDEDPAQMLEQSLRAVKRESEAVVKSVIELRRWRETWRLRRNWAIGIAVTAAIVVMIGLSIRNVQVQEMARQATATAFDATYVAVSTATAQAQATATAQAQATATAQAQATATAQAQATATAQAQATATAQVQATATSQARATATVQAIIQATVSEIEGRKQRVFGPSSGSLEHNAEDTFVSADGAGVQLKNFICTVTFFNPYSTSEGKWDYGIFFRDAGWNKQYRLSVTSDREWHLVFVDDPTWDTIASGHINNLDTSPSGRNRLRVVVEGRAAYFYVNDIYVSTLDVSRKQVSGDVTVATGIWGGHEITGRATKYYDFTVWSLP